MTFLVFVTWLFLAAVVGVFASQRRNRNGFGWFMLAVLISPMLAFLLAAAMATKDKAERVAQSDSREIAEFPLAFILIPSAFIVALFVAIFCYAVVA